MSTGIEYEVECRMLKLTGGLGNGSEYCKGCQMYDERKVMRSAAGYYIGTSDREDGSPFCRITGYFPTQESARRLL